MEQFNPYSRGQSLIGIVVVLVIVGLLGGGFYVYLSKQIPEIPPDLEEQQEEELIESEQEEEELISSEEGPMREREEEELSEASIVQKCTDGTIYGQCSSNKPKRCENGNLLVDRCSTCGCPSNSYCVSGKCLQNNIETVKKEILGSYIGGIASDNPNEYLDNHIYGLPHTGWRTYQPLINKVNELISGLSSNYEKAKAIATWVKNSKKYGDYNIWKKGASIIDLFNAQAAECRGAAILTTAMLRIAGIPARVVSASLVPVPHAYAEAHINGKWIGIDATFEKVPSGEAIPTFYDGEIFPSPNTILNTKEWIEFSDKKTIVCQELFQERAEYIEVTSMTKPLFIKKDTLYLERSSEFGPPTGEIRTTEWSKINYIQPYFVSNDRRISISRTIVETNDVGCDAFYCVENPSSKQTFILGADFTLWGKKYLYKEDGSLYVNYPTEEGGFVVIQFEPYNVSQFLPPGNYKFLYTAEINHIGPIDFAYINIDLSPEEEININPRNLAKSSNISQQDFDAFIQYLK